MIDALRAETRKLFTIRSTYVIVGICLALIVLFALYAQGIREAADISRNRLLFTNVVFNTVSTFSFLAAIVGMLLVSHEYRYNMITYTLTAARNRSRPLLAKLAVVSVFAIVLAAVLSLIAVFLVYLGAHVIQGAPVAPQQFDWFSVVWRSLFVGWGYTMFGLLVAVLIRNQVGAISTFLFFPVTIEPLLGLLLRNNNVYLPFTALQQVLTPAQAMVNTNALTPGKAAVVTMIYLVVGWGIAWTLFLRRDAN